MMTQQGLRGTLCPAALITLVALVLVACDAPSATPIASPPAEPAELAQTIDEVDEAVESDTVDDDVERIVLSRDEAIALGVYGTSDDEAVVMPELPEFEQAPVAPQPPAPAPAPPSSSSQTTQAASEPAPAAAASQPAESSGASERDSAESANDTTQAAEKPAPEVSPPATAATGSGSQQSRVEAIADRLPFDWRRAGVSFSMGCAPGRAVCNWGLYTSGPKVIWIGPDAFESEARLVYVVAHELAHAWQYANDPYARMYDLQDWNRVEVDGLEAAADCLAKAWGAATSFYWNCPASAVGHMDRVFESTR